MRGESVSERPIDDTGRRDSPGRSKVGLLFALRVSTRESLVRTKKPLPFGTLGVHKKKEFTEANEAFFIFDCLYYNGESLLRKFPLSTDGHPHSSRL